MNDQNFTSNLERLVAHELPAARRDKDRMAAMIERLGQSLALTIAVAAQGDGNVAEKLLQGSEAYIAAETARLSPIAGALP